MADRLEDSFAESLIAVLDSESSSWLATEEIINRLKSSLKPAATKESWKYTPVRDFLAGFTANAAVTPEINGANQSGITTTALSASREFARGPAALANTNPLPLADAALLYAGDAVHIKVSAEIAQPVEINYGDGVQTPIVITLEDNASLQLIERNVAQEFCNHSLFIELNRGSRLVHARSALDGNCCDWGLTQVRLWESSDYRSQQYHTGARKRRVETLILLDGRGARAELTGAYVVETGTHLDQQFVIEHRAPDTFSKQTFHGIGAGKGTIVFNGRIHIHPDSPGSDASLVNKNIALHREATINTKPELEIYTDDVKCAHGATVGQLAEDSIFYLRSRGLSRNDARTLLCRAFLSSCIEGVLTQEVTEVLLRHLADS